MKKTLKRNLKNFHKIALATALSCSYAKTSIAYAADLEINSEVSTQQNFLHSNQTLKVGNGGNLYNAGNVALIKAHSTNITGINITIDTSKKTKGVSNGSTTNPAINISGGANAANIDLKSGFIHSGYAAIVLSMSGKTNITTATDTTISGDNTAILGNYLYSSELNITNAGNILSNGIAIHDNGSASSKLSIVNSGLIRGTEFAIRSATKDSASRDVSIVNNGNIEGKMLFIGKISSTTSIVNSGNITGDIDSRLNNKISIINNSGSINGDILLNTNNVASSLTLNGGSINGDIRTGNSSHLINLNTGSYNGNISLVEGATVNIKSAKLNSTIDGTSSYNGIVNLNDDNKINKNSSLGSTNGLAEINIAKNKTIDIDGFVKTKNLNITSKATLNIGSNYIYANNTALSGTLNFGNNNRVFNGNVIGSGSGTINAGNASHNINGNLELKSGDSLAVTISNEKTFGNVNTSGAANIDSNTNLIVTLNPENQFIANGTIYKIVSGNAESNINAINDSKINVNGSNSNKFSLLTFTTSTLDNNLILNANRLSAVKITSDTSSQNAYNAINNIGSSATGELKTFQQFLDSSASKSEVSSALDSVTPQNNNGIKLSNINTIVHSIKTAENRMDEIHLASIDSNNNKTVNTNRSGFLDATYKNNGNEQGIKSGLSLGDKIEDNGIWTQTFGTIAKQDNLSNNDGYNSQSAGVAFGYDKEIIKNHRFGVALSYANSNIKSLNSIKTTNIDTYQINLYSGHSLGKYFMDNILGIALNKYSANRQISSINASAKANYNGQSYIAKTRGGFVKDLGNGFNLIPEISASYVHNVTNGYIEDGAGTVNLNVKGTNSDFLEGRVGLNFGYRTTTKKRNKVAPKISVSYGYNFLNNRQTTTSNFVGQTTTFNSLSSKIDPKSLKLGGGVDIYGTNSVLISAEYVMEQKNKYHSHSGVLRFRYEF